MPLRECVALGQTVTLRALLRDDCGELIAPDPGTVGCYIYPADVSSETIEAEVDAGTYASAIDDVSGTVSEISSGFYEASHAVPATSDTGTYADVWVAEVNGVRIWVRLTFLVVSIGRIVEQRVGKNTLIVVLLDPTIAGVSGDTLREEVQMTFSTEYDPYYSSPDLLRLECGAWIESIPDDTISLMIHWSSLEAQSIARGPLGNMFEMAKTKFVTFDAALRLLMLPASVGGKRKTLGDLMISNDSSAASMIQELKDARDEWWRVVNAKGSIVPGQSFAPEVAVKGKYDPDRRRVGRLWWSPADYFYAQPAGNTRLRMSGQRKYRTGHLSKYPRTAFKKHTDE
jgi:hypothetical protein